MQDFPKTCLGSFDASYPAWDIEWPEEFNRVVLEVLWDP